MFIKQDSIEDLIGNAVCTAAVVAVSYRSLKIFSTVRHLGIPQKDTPVASKEATPPPAPVTIEHSRWARIKRNKKVTAVFAFLAGIVAYSALVFVFGYLMPRFTSEMFLNCFWGSMEFGLISVIMRRSLAIAFPTPTAIRYVRKGDILRLEQVDLPVPNPSALHSKRFRQVLSMALSAGIMLSLYFGSTALVTLVVAAWVLHTTPGGGTLSVRRIIQVFLACLAAVPILVGLIFFMVYLFTSKTKDDKPAEPEVNFNSPSDWIVMLMMTFQGAYPYMVPAVLCSITLRYEHLCDQEPATRMSNPAALPLAEVETRSTPLFYTSIIALFASVTGMDLLAVVYPNLVGLVDQPVFQLYATVPAVILAITAAAACTGQLKDWWFYSEIWTPKTEDVDVDNVEHALSEKA